MSFRGVFQDSPTIHANFNIVDSKTGHLSRAKKRPPSEVISQHVIEHAKRTGCTDPLLTSWCSLAGQPYSLQYYPQFAPMFNLKTAPIQVWQCGRQVGKSENLTSSRYIRGRVRENYNTLMVCPRYEQSRRLSVDKAAPLIKNAVEGALTDKTCVQRAMERELINGNKVQYTHCYTGPDAARGFSVQGICYDETQDIVLAYTDIIDQCMSGSKIYYDKLYSGTPKETIGTLTIKFTATSQGFWGTRCPHCHKWSIASDDIDTESGMYDVERMIGLTGPKCLHCEKPLESAPLFGQYVHRYKDRIGYAEGYHVPQVIHYAHWGSQTKWNVLLDFYKGNPILDKDPLPRVTFVNEILGIPMDSEEMLIKPRNIEDASLKEFPNDLKTATTRRTSGKYKRIVMAVDWSGYGKEHSQSYTTPVIIGEPHGLYSPPEVLYMERFPKSTGPDEQIKMLGEMWRTFKPDAFVHDAGGGGFNQEYLLIKGGVIPPEKIVPMMYHGGDSTQNIVAPAGEGQRRGLMVARSRTLLILFLMICRGKVKLPEYKSAVACTNDFLALYRDTKTSETGVEKLRILRKSEKSDDFAHAINFGCSYIWYKRGELVKLVQNLTTTPKS